MHTLRLKIEHANEQKSEILRNEENLVRAINQNIIHYYEREPLYREGSIIKIVSVRPRHFNSRGDMDYLIGSVKTIEQISAVKGLFKIFGERWSFTSCCIAEVIKY